MVEAVLQSKLKVLPKEIKSICECQEESHKEKEESPDQLEYPKIHRYVELNKELLR